MADEVLMVSQDSLVKDSLEGVIEKVYRSIFPKRNCWSAKNQSSDLFRTNFSPSLLVERQILEAESEFTSFIDIDQFSMEWVALKLADGLLAQAGSLVFSQLVHSGIDIPTLQMQTLQRVQTIVEQAIDAAALRDLNARTEDVVSVLGRYQDAKNSDPTLARARLDDAESKISYTLAALDQFGFKAVLPYTVACGISVSIFQERYLAAKEPDKKATLSNALINYSNRVIDKGQEFVGWVYGQFGALEIYSNQPDGYFYRWKNTRVYTGTTNVYKATKLRDAHLESEHRKLATQVLGTSLDVFERWLRTLSSL